MKQNSINKKLLCAPDAEVAVLAAIMLERFAIAVVADILTENSFSDKKHQMLWMAIKSLSEKNAVIDIVTVCNELRTQGNLDKIGGPYFVTSVTNQISSSANIEFHAMILKQYEIKRSALMACDRLSRLSQDETTDSIEFLDQFASESYQLQELAMIGRSKSSGSVLDKIQNMMQNAHKLNGLTGVPTGLKDLDETYHGWQKGDLIIIGGRPSMGKTGFAVSIADNACMDYGKKCMFFSLEMTAEQLMARRLSKYCKVAAGRILTDSLNENETKRVNQAIDLLRKNDNLHIDDTAGMTITELSAKAKRAKIEFDIDFIVIDYLQLLIDPSVRGNREQEISSISRKLKALAKILQIPVIALCQLSRAVETRGGDKKPLMSDLRESGSIEQDADAVLFTYRPEYYGFEEIEDNKLKGLAMLIVSKYRNFYTGEIVCRFDKSSTTFRNVETTGITVDSDEWITPSHESPF